MPERNSHIFRKEKSLFKNFTKYNFRSQTTNQRVIDKGSV